jgi:hypothetical protein
LVRCKITRLRHHNFDGSIVEWFRHQLQRGLVMKCQDGSNDRTITEILVVGVSGLAVVGLVTAAVLVAAPRDASATPQYAQSTGKGCGYCHVNAAGGGALKGAGKRFQANGHKL